MRAEPSLLFPPFRLDLGNERLWRGSQATALRPKTFAVLRHLVAQAGQLVTTEALLDAVWPGTYVSDTLVKGSIHELRQVLGDDPKRPRFIETVHRRGYRFIAPLTTSSPVQGSRFKVHSYQPPAPTLVGREAELGQLQGWLEKALGGERQLVFVTGEPGIGKTTVVKAFLEQVAVEGQVWIGRGQCIEHYGAGEAYLPGLEALGRLCREPGGERLMELLSHYAPTWLVQMPALFSAADLEALQRKTQGATRERMLREIVEAVEALTVEQPLVLWLEDLHWSDYSTLDLLAYLARRPEKARLLVLGTYRPVEMLGKDHPLHTVKQELQLHGHCREFPLGYLTEAAVREYLAGRFAGSPLPAKLARVIHHRTEGNPLFMVTIVDYLIAWGALVASEGQWHLNGKLEALEAGVPETLQQLIERQLERLSPEDQRVLEVASVAGAEFSAAAVAAGIEAAVGEVEARCESLARRKQFVRARGGSEWPDGTVAARYSFLHALYQQVVYERVPIGGRIDLHRRIGEREEAAYAERAAEVAAELAVHFEQGREYARAVRYREQAAQRALGRNAYQEASGHLTKGLELLKLLPDTPERAQQELTLQIALGTPLMATQGFAAPEAGAAYARARELCRQVGETPELFPVLMRLGVFYLGRAEHQTALELGRQGLRLAQTIQDPVCLSQAHHMLGCFLCAVGELPAARAHLEQGLTFYHSLPHHAVALRLGVEDSEVSCLNWLARALWALGYPEQALQRSTEVLTLAEQLAHPYSLAFTLGCAMRLHHFRREIQVAKELAEAAVALCTEQGFAFWLAVGTMYRGWALAEQGQGETGIVQIHQGLAAYRATGAEVSRPRHLAVLAEAYRQGGQVEEGLSVVAEALATVHKTGERFDEAELHRLKGELTLAQSRVRGQWKSQAEPASSVPSTQHPTPSTHAEAEECFWRAIEIARRQSAKSWELRAVMSLSRLWQSQGKKKQARRMLAEVYGWFTEGFDTADLQEAKALLEELSGRHQARRRKQ